MYRLLVVGAGASIEECKQSGNYRDDLDRCFPTISNFCNKLFDPHSDTLLRVTASYLKAHNISFESKMLNLKIGDSFDIEDTRESPIGIFLELERKSFQEHNIERLCEYAWHVFREDTSLWDSFIHDGIYFKLFALFTEQFGLGIGVPMSAGKKVAKILKSGDKIINLNYDIALDLALKQSGKIICYAPDFGQNAISILKPHGSLNLYVNLENGNCFFEEPDQIRGSVSIPDPYGGFFSPHSGIIPPRLNKNYLQHPSARIILNTDRPFFPKIVTFWGVGLTSSDTDLLTVYREATSKATKIEFINPSVDAFQNAAALLRKNIIHYTTLNQWIDAQNRL